MAKQILAERRAKSTVPTPPSIENVWQPNPGPQQEFYESTCREVLFGGAAGGGKSAALTAIPLKYAHLAGFEAVTLRRETTQLDDLIKKAELLYEKILPDSKLVHSPNAEWTFPAGGKLKYRHCQLEHDYKKFDGWELNLVNFDELTHFTENQYKFICARVRSADKTLPTLIRATTNPGGPGHEWVFRHWGAWLDPNFKAPGLEPRFDENGEHVPPAKPSEVWWIRTEDGKETYYRSEPPVEFLQDENGEFLLDPKGNKIQRPPALSRTFIPARLQDNPKLAEADPAYVAQLNAISDPVRRAQLKSGDWLIKPGKGLYFKRAWVANRFVDVVPARARRIRSWDLAGTEKKDGKSDPDWTVGTLVSLGDDGQTYVEDVVRARDTPGKIEDLIVATAEIDGHGVSISIPQDPGQAGKSQAENFARKLRGYNIISRPVTGEKRTRFSPFSAHAEKGLVSIKRGPWNADFVGELESFPEGSHDDQADAVADGFNLVASVPVDTPTPKLDSSSVPMSRWGRSAGRGF